MALKPRDQFISELLGRNTDSSTMVGAGNLPKKEGRVVSRDRAGVTERNIAVLLAVDKEDRNAARRGNSQRRNISQIDVVIPLSVSESRFDDGIEKSSSKPRSRVEELANAIVGNFAEGRKRTPQRPRKSPVRFGGKPAIVRHPSTHQIRKCNRGARGSRAT